MLCFDSVMLLYSMRFSHRVNNHTVQNDTQSNRSRIIGTVLTVFICIIYRSCHVLN